MSSDEDNNEITERWRNNMDRFKTIMRSEYSYQPRQQQNVTPRADNPPQRGDNPTPRADNPPQRADNPTPRADNPADNSHQVPESDPDDDEPGSPVLDHTREVDHERPLPIPNEESFNVIASRIHFKRNRQFGLEDTLFKLRFEANNPQHPPYLIDIMESLAKALRDAINAVKRSFRNDTHRNRQIFITWLDESIENGLNGGGWSILTDTDTLVDEHLDLLASFLQSNRHFTMDHSFSLNIKVLSKRHEDYNVQNKNYVPHYGKKKRGRKKKVSNRIGTLLLCQMTCSFIT